MERDAQHGWLSVPLSLPQTPLAESRMAKGKDGIVLEALHGLDFGLSMTRPGQVTAALKTSGTNSRVGQQTLGFIALGDFWLYLNILRSAGWVLLPTVTQPPASGLQCCNLYFCLSDMSLSGCPSTACQRGTGINTEMEISQMRLSPGQISGEKLDPVTN